MHDPLGSEVVERRAELERQRDQLLGLQRPVATDQGREPRPLEVLEDEVGPVLRAQAKPRLSGLKPRWS